MQEEAHEDAAPMNLEKSLHSRREGRIDEEKGWRGVAVEVLKVLQVKNVYIIKKWRRK